MFKFSPKLKVQLLLIKDLSAIHQILIDKKELIIKNCKTMHYFISWPAKWDVEKTTGLDYLEPFHTLSETLLEQVSLFVTEKLLKFKNDFLKKKTLF